MADLPIQYRDFYDVPHMFVVRQGPAWLLFDGSFDDELDDYPDEYAVYELPAELGREPGESWVGLRGRAIAHLGSVPVADVRFDATRRRFVDSASIRVAARAVG